ncbi:MAG: aminopeptidase, partial [Isosphaeraceae bacterium]
MQPELIKRWADLLTDYCLQVQAGETVLIMGEVPALELVDQTARAVIRRGGLPIVRLDIPGLTEYLVENGTDDQLTALPVSAFADAGSVDARVRITAETDEDYQIDPDRQAMFHKAREPLRRLSARK